MLVAPLWCDLGCCSQTVVIIESAAKIRLSCIFGLLYKKAYGIFNAKLVLLHDKLRNSADAITSSPTASDCWVLMSFYY